MKGDVHRVEPVLGVAHYLIDAGLIKANCRRVDVVTKGWTDDCWGKWSNCIKGWDLHYLDDNDSRPMWLFEGPDGEVFLYEEVAGRP